MTYSDDDDDFTLHLDSEFERSDDDMNIKCPNVSLGSVDDTESDVSFEIKKERETFISLSLSLDFCQHE